VVCRFAKPGSPLAKALHPSLEWTVPEYLLAELTDLARFTFWRDSDAKSRGPKPDPITRPGQEPPDREIEVVAVESMDLDEGMRWMAARLREREVANG
jgi:hypothetical protein